MAIKKTVRLDLVKEAPPLAGRVAYITLKAYNVDKGRPCVSPDCASFGELDYWINHLIDDLEAIRKEGKKFFER